MNKLTRYQEMLLHHLVDAANKSEKAADEARRLATEDRRVLVLFFAVALDRDAENIRLGSWYCPKGPKRDYRTPCVFDVSEDPAEDVCLFCGHPEERK